MNPRKAATLVATLVEYAVKNVNLAVDALDLQREEFDDDDDFFDGIFDGTSVETDDFIIEMATSEPYLPSTIDALQEKGYRVVEEEDDDDDESECCPQKMAECLVRLLGKKAAVMMVMEQE